VTIAPPDRTAAVLRRARETLETAGHGLKDLKSSSQGRRLSGLRNMVVFGRAVTNVLQNLRSIEPAFETWYTPIAEDMRHDPLMKYFYDLRSKVLKEGDPNVGTWASVDRFRVEDLGPPPKNAIRWFICDGVGWEIETEPGIVERYYVDHPSVRGGYYFIDAPEKKVILDGVHTSDTFELGRRYVARLQAILLSAEETFGGAAAVSR
jgi:hypothetical protein